MELLEEVKFNILKTLYIIEHNKDLNKIFKGYYPDLSYNSLRIMAKDASLEPKVLEISQNIFDSIIKENSKMLEKYVELNLKKIAPKPSKYYGKEKILKDIIKAGKKTDLDHALFAINDLRNITARLRRKCIIDKTSHLPILTKEDYRNIAASVSTLQKKLKYITKK